MNTKTFKGFVAFLIATLTLISFTASQVYAQAQPAWTNAQTVKAVEYGTKDEAGNCQILSNGQVSCRFYLSAKADEIAALDSYAVRPGLQLKRTGETIVGFAPGTPGTVTMRKLMFCLGGKISSNANLTEAERAGAVRCYGSDTVYSHVLTPEKERVSGLSETLVTNPKIAYFTQAFWSGYVEDQGDIGIAFVPAYKQTLLGKEFAFCPTGTREIRKWYNNAYARAQTGQINDSSWRFSNNFAWRDGVLPQGFETSVDDEVLCGPAEAEKLWVINEAPVGQIATNVISGNFLSRFTLNLNSLSASTKENVWVDARNRTIDYDQSRNNVYYPNGNRRTIQAKSATVQSNIATEADSRLAVAVYERTGDIFHFSTSTYGNRVFVYNPKTSTVTDFITATGTVPNLTTSINVDTHIQGAIFGDMLFRVIGVNESGVANAITKTKVEVWDIPTRALLREYTIDRQLALNGQIFGARPEIAFDPRLNALWIATSYLGQLGVLDLNSGVYTSIPIQQETLTQTINGSDLLTVGAMDVTIDTASNKTYVAIAKWPLSWFSQAYGYVNGAVWEYDLATRTVSRKIDSGVAPYSVTIVPSLSGTKIATAVSYGADSFVQFIDATNLIDVGRARTEQQPTFMAIDLKD